MMCNAFHLAFFLSSLPVTSTKKEIANMLVQDMLALIHTVKSAIGETSDYDYDVIHVR